MASKGIVSKSDVRMVLCLLLTLVGAFLIVTEKQLPDAFIGIWGTGMGYYFASRENGEERNHTETMAKPNILGRREGG